MVDLTLILVFGRLLTVDSNNYPVQQSWFQRSQKRNVQNVHVDRFPSHARKGEPVSHITPHACLSDVMLSQGTSRTLH